MCMAQNGILRRRYAMRDMGEGRNLVEPASHDLVKLPASGSLGSLLSEVPALETKS